MNGIAQSIVAGGVSDIIKKAAKPQVEKKRIERDDERTREAIQEYLLQNHQGQRYYNSLDGYLTRNHVIDNLIKSFRRESDLQPVQRSEFIRYNLEAFSAIDGNRCFTSSTMDRYGLEKAFDEIYDLAYEGTTAIPSYSEIGKLDIRMQSRGAEQTNVILQGVERIVKDYMTNMSVYSSQDLKTLDGKLSLEAESIHNEIKEVESLLQRDARYRDAVDRYLNLLLRLTTSPRIISDSECGRLSSQILENVAICYANLGEIEQADQYAQQVRNMPEFNNRQSAQYLCAAIEVYYRDNPDYNSALAQVKRALQIDPNYGKAFLLKELILFRLQPENLDDYLCELESVFENRESEEGIDITEDLLAEYYVHKGAILREAGRIADSIFCYEKAIELGYDHMIVSYNLAIAHYRMAVQGNPLDKRILFPKINYPELLNAYEVLRPLVHDDKLILDRLHASIVDLYGNICVLLDKDIEKEIPDNVLHIPGVSSETRRMILLSRRDPISADELSELSEADRHFVKARDLLNNNKPEECRKYCEALITVSFEMTAPLINLLLQTYEMLNDPDAYLQYRDIAIQAGVSERLITVYDADFAVRQGRMEDARRIIDNIAEQEDDFQLLSKALQFYKDNHLDNQCTALYCRIAEKHRQREVFFSNPDSFYFEAIAYVRERDPQAAKAILDGIEVGTISELQKCRLRVIVYEKYHDFKEIADASLQAFALQENYADGLNAVLSLTALTRYQDALPIAERLPDLAPDDEDRTKAFQILSDLFLLLHDSKNSFLWAKKVHELNIEKPAHPSHQAYAARSLRCGCFEEFEEIKRYKELHPIVIQWIQFGMIPNTKDSKELEACLKEITGISVKEYSCRETNWIMYYKQGIIPLHSLLRFYHGSIISLYSYSQRHQFRISRGNIEIFTEQTKQIQDTVITDAYTLILLSMCECLDLMKKPWKILVPEASISLLQQFFLLENCFASASALDFIQQSDNVEIIPDGVFEKSAAERVFAPDVDACLHIAERRTIPYMSCEAVLETLLNDPNSDLPKANYVSITSAVEVYMKDNPEQQTQMRLKLIRKCSFVNFRAEDILRTIEQAEWTIDSEILRPYLNFKSSCDSVSYVCVYGGVLAELYKHDAALQEQFLWLLIDNLEKTWKRGQHYRSADTETVNKAVNCNIDPRAKAIDAYVIQCTILVLSFSEKKWIVISEKQKNRLISLAEEVVQVEHLSKQDIDAFIQFLSIFTNG